MNAQEFIEQGSGIITLCGSTRYFFEAMEANRQLTFQNWIVLMCGSWGHSFHKYIENTNTDYTRVKRLHFHKIAISDAVVVVFDATHYTGKSTEKEIDFARDIGLPVFFFNGDKFFGSIDAKPLPSHSPHKTELIAKFEDEYGLGY